jgi:hypothetical protein
MLCEEVLFYVIENRDGGNPSRLLWLTLKNGVG